MQQGWSPAEFIPVPDRLEATTLAGKPRPPAIVILLFIATLGVYWFVWLHHVVGELAADRGRTYPFWGMLATMIVLWAGAFGVGAALAIRAVRRITRMIMDGAAPDQVGPAWLPWPFNDPGAWLLFGAGIALTIVFYAVQARHLSQVNHFVVEQACDPVQGSARPAAMLAVLASLLLAAGQIPFVGSLMSVAGAAGAIIWVVQVQSAANQYWQARGRGWAPPDATTPSPATTASDPPGTG